jgi:hypothetical protein
MPQPGWVELDDAGVKQILHSPEVVAQLTTLANKVAAAAKKDAQSAAYREALAVETRVKRNRTSVDVIAPFGAEIEAKHGILHRALAGIT